MIIFSMMFTKFNRKNNYRIALRALFIIFLIVTSAISFAQEKKITFEKNKCRVSYDFVLRNDSTFMVGIIKDKNNVPVSDINIMINEFRIGTVANQVGEFELFLPKNQGIILFDKTSFTRFTMAYQFIR